MSCEGPFYKLLPVIAETVKITKTSWVLAQNFNAFYRWDFTFGAEFCSPYLEIPVEAFTQINPTASSFVLNISSCQQFWCDNYRPSWHKNLQSAILGYIKGPSSQDPLVHHWREETTWKVLKRPNIKCVSGISRKPWKFPPTLQPEFHDPLLMSL